MGFLVSYNLQFKFPTNTSLFYWERRTKILYNQSNLALNSEFCLLWSSNNVPTIINQWSLPAWIGPNQGGGISILILIFFQLVQHRLACKFQLFSDKDKTNLKNLCQHNKFTYVSNGGWVSCPLKIYSCPPHVMSRLFSHKTKIDEEGTIDKWCTTRRKLFMQSISIHPLVILIRDIFYIPTPSV